MPDLKMPPDQAVRLLSGKVDEITRMLAKREVLAFYDFVGWCSKTWSMIDDIYRADDPHPEDIRIIGTLSCACGSPEEAQRALLQTYGERLLTYIGEIEPSGEKTG